MKLDRQSKQFFFVSMLLVLTIMFVIGWWTADVASGALEKNALISSIAGYRDANFSYHLGLGVSILSFALLGVMFCYLVVTMKEEVT